MSLKDKYKKKDLDFYAIYELIEMGCEDEEIAKDFGVSSKYIRNLRNNLEKFNDDY